MRKLREPARPTRPGSTEATPVAAVERALSLLAAFRIGEPALSLGDLAERTGLNKATILRLAATLQRFGYVSRLPAGDYRIGPAPLALATMFQRATQPAERILPALERLARETGESAAFFIKLNDEERVCLYRIDSRHAVREHVRAGDVGPIGKGAAGRVLAKTSAALVITAAEVTPDVRAAAAPVFDAAGRVAGAITVSGPQFRFTSAASKSVSAALLSAAREVTLHIGGDPTIFDSAPGGRHAD